jgi:hypothetical protein
MGKYTLIQWSGKNRSSISSFLDFFECEYSFTNDTIHIFYADAELVVEPSDWVCENAIGELSVLNHSDFIEKHGNL